MSYCANHNNLAQGNSFFSYSNWKNTNPHATIAHYIAQSLVQGSIKAYKTASVSALNESRQLRSFKDTDGKKFELQPAASVLANMAVTAKSATSEASTAQIIKNMAITGNIRDIQIPIYQYTTNIRDIQIL